MTYPRQSTSTRLNSVLLLTRKLCPPSPPLRGVRCGCFLVVREVQEDARCRTVVKRVQADGIESKYPLLILRKKSNAFALPDSDSVTKSFPASEDRRSSSTIHSAIR